MAFSESYKERDLKHYVHCDDDKTGFRVHPILLSELSEYLQFTLTGEKCLDSILRGTLILHLFLKQLCLLYINTSWLEHRRNKIMLPFHMMKAPYLYYTPMASKMQYIATEMQRMFTDWH